MPESGFVALATFVEADIDNNGTLADVITELCSSGDFSDPEMFEMLGKRIWSKRRGRGARARRHRQGFAS